MFAVSFLCHLAIFLLIAKFQFLPALHPVEQQVTYVDLMNLPVASPRSGSATPAAESESEAQPAPAAPAAPPPPAAPAAPKKPEMALPAKKAPTAKAKPEKPVPAKPAQAKTEPQKPDEAREFNERMAKLERQADEKRLASTLENLKKKSGTGGRAGMPGFKGSQAGSDYGAYLGSRVQDAMNKMGAAHRTASPKVMVTITIGTDGAIADYHVDRPSGDFIFDDSVQRAVYQAAKTLKPPPTGRPFKQGFSFTPKEVVIR